jgi:hypothetical protein
MRLWSVMTGCYAGRARLCQSRAAGSEMSMPKFVEVLPWVATNKDALLALGAFLAPVTSIIAAAVSYRAVVTGPKVQMRIAQQQNELAEKQFALTEQQARFASIGASEQKWISDFQEMLAHLFALGFRAISIILRRKDEAASSDQQRTTQLLSDLNSIHIEAVNLISRIEFHLGRERQFVISGFRIIITEWFFPKAQFDAQSFDQDVWTKRERDIFESAQRIISEHEAKIPFNQTAAGQEAQELAALEKQGRELRELRAARRSWRKRRALKKQERELEELAVRRSRQVLEDLAVREEKN